MTDALEPSNYEQAGWSDMTYDYVQSLRTDLSAALARAEAAEAAMSSPALGAEWMRREINTLIQNEIKWCMNLVRGTAGIRLAYAEDLQQALEAIPGPTAADLLADALALPQVAALVEALDGTSDAFGCECGETARDALAGLKGGAE